MEDLKRVGLIFKSEGTVDFKKSLQEVNIEMNKSYNQFKLTQAQWDSSTTSTQKLRAETEHLKEVYEIQEDRVKILRAQLSELENAENKNTTAIKKKRNELTNAEIKLKDYENKIKDIEGRLKNWGKALEEVGMNLEDTGRKIENVGKKITPFSLAVAGAFTASAKSAIDFETAVTGVEKTVDGTPEQLEALKQGIRDIAKEIPATTTEISSVAEVAGQLGIETDNIIDFTRVMIDLGQSTNLSSEEAASSLAKFANVTKMSVNDYGKLGSVIVALGNNFATTERDIVDMATKLAATGELTGLSQAQIMALATSMSSVGIEAEAGGSAMSKLLKKIQVACETGSNELKQFSNVAGMSADEFKDAFEKDAVGALSSFLSGLNDTERNGKSAIAILDDMKISEVRLSNTILSLSNASEVMNKAVKIGNDEWEDNTALTKEANKRYETLESKIKIALNKLKDFAITIGQKLTPYLDKAIDKIDDLSKWVENLTDEQIEFILKVGATVVALGPLLTIFGKLTSAIGTGVKAFGTITQAVGVARGTITSTSTAVNGLAKVFSAITSPVGVACLAVTASIGLITLAMNEAKKEAEKFSKIGNSANSFIDGINSAKGYLASFNSTLFASNEEQQQLQKNMNEIQNGITEICKRASDERRNYTEEEITQLDEYFDKLRELKNREIEIQNELSKAISQQAISNAEAFQGSLDEYKIQSQEWIKTAEEQKNNTLKIIEDGTIQEVALLNQRYSTEEDKQTEAYKKEYNSIMTHKQEKIDAANEEVKKVLEVYTEGYAQRANQDGDFFEHLEHYNWEQENEENRHNSALESIKNNRLLTESNKLSAIRSENDRHEKEINEIWKNMYKNMSDSEAEQLGIWLALVTQTQMYGGQISDEAQTMADNVIESFDSMPDGTREAMKNAMVPMLNEMEKAEPSLFAKAKSIGTGILSRLRKAFDEHSPSKETRKIMKFAMQPMEEEVDKGKKNIWKKTDELAVGIKNRLNNLSNSSNNLEFKVNTDYESSKENESELKKYNEFLNFSIKDFEKIINYEKLTQCFIKAIEKIGIYIDKNALVGNIAPEINGALAEIKEKDERGS